MLGSRSPSSSTSPLRTEGSQHSTQVALSHLQHTLAAERNIREVAGAPDALQGAHVVQCAHAMCGCGGGGCRAHAEAR